MSDLTLGNTKPPAAARDAAPDGARDGARDAARRRRSKIVATLGPATDHPDVLERLIRAGADVVRINFSHGSAEDWARRVRAVRDTAARVGRYVGIVGDLQGPKIRIESFRDGAVTLEPGEAFVLDTAKDPSAGDERSVGVAYRRLPDEVRAGDAVLLDDGRIVLAVDEVRGTEVRCRVTRGGRVSNRKGLNKQGGGLSAPALSDKDRADIETAASLELDFVAVSFAREAADIDEARSLLRAAGGEGYVIAKIERAEAVENIGSIIDASDAIMVARGDLAVEVGYASMTSLQKGLIREARERDKVSITATQMLESMVASASPTRAEVSDVANAVMDGTDAVMLSAETAVGQHPVEAVETMARICVGAEKHETAGGRPSHLGAEYFRYVDEAIAMAAMYTANHLKVRAIVALTESGSTALWMSRVRSDIPIYAFTRHEVTRRRVTLYRGVYPVSFDLEHMDPAHVHSAAFATLLRDGAVAPGDLVLLTRGQTKGVTGGTNTMQIVTVPAK